MRYLIGILRVWIVSIGKAMAAESAAAIGTRQKLKGYQKSVILSSHFSVSGFSTIW
jgi:hypothetical protein